MKEPGRPVKLHFFCPTVNRKFLDLCAQMEIGCCSDKLPDDSFSAETQQLTATERRTLIGKWSDVSIERIG